MSYLCANCGAPTLGSDRRCPRCGSLFQDAADTEAAGLLLIPLVLIVALVCLAVAAAGVAAALSVVGLLILILLPDPPDWERWVGWGVIGVCVVSSLCAQLAWVLLPAAAGARAGNADPTLNELLMGAGYLAAIIFTIVMTAGILHPPAQPRIPRRLRLTLMLVGVLGQAAWMWYRFGASPWFGH